MRILAPAALLAATMALSACETGGGIPGLTANEQPSKTVTVYTRTWAVTQVHDEPVTYRATRDNNNLNPFGQPPRTRTSQAIAAIQKATGCKVVRNSMYQNISGQVFSQVSCN
ncbi:hypothetical protein [Primorskyibacter sp. S87]|uniref:hypothetical protein n=1 Tax=Primorskyibacter sp. S87 TaxID=3415126 RepID=UPI003C7B5B69